MNQINYIKMSGAGNDFVIIDARTNPFQFSNQQINWICDRKNIGCDQFILIKNSQQADILMEIYNADGSKSGACGNATRCVADLIMSEKNQNHLFIETASGILECWRVDPQSKNLIAVNMGKPKFEWQKIPLAKALDVNNFKISEICDYQFSAVNMGNPHIVAFLDHEIADEEFFRIGPQLEKHQLFPEKTNVEFANIIAPDHIKVRVWERGSGETLACGSGACAVAISAIKKDLASKEKITVSFKGGDLIIQWQEDNSVIMTGGFKIIKKASL